MKTSSKSNKPFLNIKPALSNYLGIFFAGVIFGFLAREIPGTPKIFVEDTYEYGTAPSKDMAGHEEKPFLPYSIPAIYRPGYTLDYDSKNKNPYWVYEHLTSDSLKGNTERKNFQFKEDPSIPDLFRSTLSDYKGSGFDRGHLAPAGDHKASNNAMSDTFYMSNMCPQCPAFNRGYWNQLEKHVRDLTKSYQHVYVITGPLYLPQVDADGNKYVKYRVIGKNDVAVPTHFFKVINLESSSGEVETKAYILPNEEISANTLLNRFETTVRAVERASGMILSSKNNP